MNILDKYIARNLYYFVIMVSITLLAVDLLFYFINEIRFIGQGNYNLREVMIFIGLTIPRKIYIMFPWAALIGSLIALGGMAKNHELVAMQSASVSRSRIALATVKAALVLTIFLFILGEVIAPKTEKIAQKFKTRALSSGQTIHTMYGTWIRNKNDIIHIGRVVNKSNLQNIKRFSFDDNLKLQQTSQANSANYNYDKDIWELHEVIGTKIESNTTSLFNKQYDVDSNLIDQNILEASAIKNLERLSIFNLYHVIKQRLANELHVKDYQLAFWTKIFKPISLLVMVYISVPFIFGYLRNSSIGLKVLIGILVGFSFHIVNSILAPLIIITTIPAFIAALLPTAVFFMIAYYANLRLERLA